MSTLQALDVYKQYGKKPVVKGISLDINRGEIVGLLGPNGAGKTTTFYMLVGIIPPTKGRVALAGQDITGLSLPKRAELGMSYLPQESSIFKKLSVYDNLMLILEYTCRDRKLRREKAESLMHELGISKLAHQKASFLSGGERRRLEIARSLIKDPEFILLDEPFAGIDPIAVDDIQKIVLKLKEKNIGVLISDHNVRETLKICDRASLVFEGQVILNGTPGEIAQDARARQVYLGESFQL
ncbi:ABC transporter related protein [Desulfonatronospira thiodismutans ASO3-1]|uniref:ABC transporter related protein n=1 Tax=Desulfonatronospira thiodismutans ASO3-1 TaxID=555779 RepID=D6SSF2_9BACT|nr:MULTISPECIES: LPS export ABC transporter ATP-binding protein [Desulfonatronospira]EFI33618.1 ABC transporter related protein [Desulfonatronospira thiodismutans ASO3-1]RQD73672.1 MAG: LPS export ABC transporter ATP-binding protein [Desulfonatronospira sp. MSAO_Bac3]